jgi:hypothetical protein
MEKFQVDSKNDILAERYKGPGPVVAGAGYIYISHLASTIAGAIALGALGALASGKALAIKEAFTKFGTTHADSPNSFKKAAAWFVGGIPKLADYSATKLTGTAKKISGNRIGHVNEANTKTAAFMFAGGIGAVSGWIGSTIWGGLKGGHEGNVGKRQFNRAKAEIKDLRERNDDLEKINDELHAKYVAAATQKDEAAQQPAVSEKPADTLPSAAPHITSSPFETEAKNLQLHHETPEHSIHTQDAHAEHHGKIHAHAQRDHAAHAHT